jgi:hypothetical protein
MNTSTLSGPPTAPVTSTPPTSALRRFFGVVGQPRSYRNLAYLLLGLPLGIVWFTVVVTVASVGVSMIVVALLGIPLLVVGWYLVRACANVERAVTNGLAGQHLPMAPMAANARGGLWSRCRTMSSDPLRWRELGYLLLRLPAGIATFTIAVTALAVPVAVAYAPFSARFDDDHTFGDWAYSSTLEDVATSPWAWLLVPAGVVALVVSFHAMNALAERCGRWTERWLSA